MSYKFECEHCGCEAIDEVMIGMIVYSEITSIQIDSEDRLALEYGKCVHDNMPTSDPAIHYECNNCGTEVSLEQMKATSGLGE